MIEKHYIAEFFVTNICVTKTSDFLMDDNLQKSTQYKSYTIIVCSYGLDYIIISYLVGVKHY